MYISIMTPQAVSNIGEIVDPSRAPRKSVNPCIISDSRSLSFTDAERLVWESEL